MISAIYVSSRASEPQKSAEAKAAAETAQSQIQQQKKVNHKELIAQIEAGNIKPTYRTQDGSDEYSTYENVADLGDHYIRVERIRNYDDWISRYRWLKIKKNNHNESYEYKKALSDRGIIYWCRTSKKSANK